MSEQLVQESDYVCENTNALTTEQIVQEFDYVRENMNDLHETVAVLKGRISMGAEVTEQHVKDVNCAVDLLKAANNLLDRCR